MGNGLLRHLSNELIDVKGVTKNECDVTNKQHVKDIIQLSSTTELIGEYIDDVATDNNKESIKNLMIDIYEEAMSIEE